MPVRYNPNDAKIVRDRLAGLLSNMSEEYRQVGEVAAQEVIRTTLAGIGAGDQPFAPYSKGYLAKLAAAGGKLRQVVDLRGVFFSGAGKAKGKPATRPQRGLTDKQSEMSLDLVGVKATDGGILLTYTPRVKPYMIAIQNGDGDQPARPWFSVNKASVMAAVMTTLKGVVLAKVRRSLDSKSTAIIRFIPPKSNEN